MYEPPRSFDRGGFCVAQNYSAEAARYEAMRPNTAPTPVFTAPNTAPKPKITTPGAEKTALSGPAGHLSQRERQETTATPTGTYADREGLELQIANLQSEMQAYTKASGGKGDLQVLIWYVNQIHDAMKAMEALPTEPVREDILLQGVGGNYYQGERTKAGTVLELGLGVTPFQMVTDARDIIYDLQNWDEVSTMQKIGDISALLSVTNGLKNATRALELLKQSGKVSAAVIDAAQSLAAAVYFLGGKAVDGVGGLLKKVGKAVGSSQYADEAAALIKNGQRAVEAAGDMAKHGDDLVDAGGELVYNGARQLDNVELMPDNLMEELAHSGVKYTPEDVLMVTKNSDGDLLWLETGNESAGLTHFLQRHEEDFKNCGIAVESLPDLLKEILVTPPDSIKRMKRGWEAVYTHNGMRYKVAYGTNGFIVSFYPIGKK